MKKLDIGLVCQNVVRRDGQGRVMLELARSLVSRGHAVTVYAHRLEDELADRTTLRRIPRPAGPQLVDDLSFLAVATLRVRRASHDVVCVLGPVALPRRPFVYNAQFSHRGWRATWTRSTRPGLYHRVHARILGALEAVVARRADRIVSSTAALAREVLRGAEPKTVVVPNGVDLSEFTVPGAAERAEARRRFGVDDHDLAIGFFGGWATPRKGLDPLLRALASSEDGEKLLVANEGDRRSLEERTRELRVGERVHVCGFEPPQRVLAACDLVVVPSLYEPWSLVAFEAAATERPVVISAAAGAASHLEGAAVVCEPEPAELRRAIDHLRTDPDERRRLAAAGRRAAEALAWDVAMAKAADVVEGAAAGPGPSSERPALRVLPPRELRDVASVPMDDATTLWSRALARDGAGPPLVSLLDDWSEWSGATYPEMLRSITEAQQTVDREWEERQPEGAEEVAAFYDSTDTQIPLLLWWHANEPRPARCAAAAAAVVGATGGRRVLDFGCGIGSTSLALAARGLEPVLADVSRRTMRFAEWRMRARSRDPEIVDLLDGSLRDLPDASFDGVVAFDVFEHIPNLDETLQELDRVLRRGGIVCFNQIFIASGDVPEHYPVRGEPLLWLHRRGYRLTHVMDVCWVAQKAALRARERAAQTLSLRARVAAARVVEPRRGPIGRRVAFHTLRHAIS